jgi:hypothetical protein
VHLADVADKTKKPAGVILPVFLPDAASSTLRLAAVLSVSDTSCAFAV